jgi:hypothetical protein
MAACQYLMDVPPDLRCQVDYVFALKESIMTNKIKLWKFFFGMFPTYDSFSKVFDECTRDHRAIVLDNTQSNTDVSECIFWYKAEKRESFTLFSQKFWVLAATHKPEAQSGTKGKKTLESINDALSTGKAKVDAVVRLDDPENANRTETTVLEIL